MTRTVLIKDAQLEYCALNNPKALKLGDTPRYSACILLSRDNTENLDTVRAAATECAKAIYGEAIPDDFDLGIRDGADKNNPEFHDVFYINAKSRYPIQIVAGKNKTLYKGIEPDGAIATVSLRLHPYSYSGNKGISWRLEKVWIRKKGTPIARNEDLSVFDGIDGSDCDEFDTQPQKSAEDELIELLS